jgi:hypothetical protein
MIAGILLSPLCNAGPESTEEVLVRGTRLRDLRAAIVTAEDRFYEQYNALNKVDDFDIECIRDAHTGTRIPQRRCFARVLREAMPPNTDPAAVWAARYDEYRDNMLYLLKMHPELRHLASEGEAAQRRYDAEYRRRLKGRAVLFE